MYVYNTLLTVFTLGLPKAFSYYLPRVDISQANNLIKKITNIFFILGAVFSIFLFVCADPIADFMNNQDLKEAIKIFSPVPLMLLPTMGLEGILSTYRKNKFMTLYTVITRMFMLICVATPVIFFNGGYIEAIWGFVISSFISFVLALYLKYMPVKGKGKEKCEITYNQIFKFALPLLYASLWGILIASADQFFISRYFGNEVFAEFSNGAIELPFVGMIVGACATVLSPIFSRMSNEQLDPQKEIYPLWKSVFEKSAKLIYPLVIYSIIFADIIMIVLYGEQYECSATYFRIKSIVDFFRVIVYAPLIINIGKVKYYANVHMYGAIILIILEYISVITINDPHAILVVSVLCTLGRIFCMLIFVSKFFKVKLYQLFPLYLIFKILIPSIIILVAEHYLLVNILNLNNIIVLFISFGLYMIAFYLISSILKIDYKSLIKPLLSK
jgi:O-antigen/teichoic acid export membrane protein